MISLLARIFIKNHDDYQSPTVRQAYGMLCGAAGIGLNILLFIGKWLAGTLSGSIAITADAFNNLSDAGSSVITLIGFKLSGQKPDPEHPFGHGRMEYISGLFVSVAILIMGFELIKSSVGKILHPEAIESSPVILAILVASILVKLYMCFYNRSIGKKINSAAMRATANDSLSDTVSTTLVLAATIISQLTGVILDGWFGVLVGIFIFYTGITTMKDTMDPLLGQAPDKELVNHIEEVVMAHPIVHGIHDLIVHDYGPGRLMISLHAEVSASGNLLEIHDEIDNIEHELQQKLNCAATIHMDPIVTDNEEVNRLHDRVLELAKSLDSSLNIHDFRMVEGPTHTNLIFDVAVPYECKMTDVEVSNTLKKGVRELSGGQYFAVIQVDRVYC
ncbi:MAG: cation diffusion facilitator family transporter [Blautia sp.]|nr:cation diffusion facilitator family transporter [Blautia sp.]MDD7730415.1 cation diffusion facilitator family transporter [Clostridia bacterium]MDY5664483.1 cation diffusion facilitator family transporter [Blautia sp.]